MLRIDEQYVYDKIEQAGGMEEITKAVELILTYRITDFYESKNALIQAWQIDYQNIYDLIISVFTLTLTNEAVTYQAMVGILNHKIKLDSEIDRIKILADLIGLIASTGLIDIHSEKGKYHMISTEYGIDSVIPQEDRHPTTTEKIEPVKSNRGTDGSILLGHKMNHHNEYVRLSHLNRMQQMPLKLNKEFINSYEEGPKNDPVTKEQIAQWKTFKEESLKKYEELMASDQQFFIGYKYDYRGRSYSCSYYLNPQGSSFKKAMIDLADKEIVEGF